MGTGARSCKCPVWPYGFVSCRLQALGVTLSQSVLSEAASCRSIGALRRLLVLAYGSCGMSVAFELAGILQPPKPAESLQPSRASQNVDGKPDSPSRDGITGSDAIAPSLLAELPGMPRRLLNWMLAPDSEPPSWQSETVRQREEREFF
jgi:hypothetical protein